MIMIIIINDNSNNNHYPHRTCICVGRWWVRFLLGERSVQVAVLGAKFCSTRRFKGRQILFNWTL